MTSRPDAERTVRRRSIGGASAMLVGLPLLVYYLWICLAHNQGALIVPTSAADGADLLARVPGPTPGVVGIVLGWVLVQAALHLVVPGPSRDGLPLAGGSGLPYRMNGWRTWWLTWAGLAALVWLGGMPATALADQLGPLLTAANLVAFALSAVLVRAGAGDGGGPGSIVRRFVAGSALNPRIGPLDLKLFFEGRPGLIGWIAINLSLAAKQHELHGAVTTPMLLVNAFAILYVADYFWNEEATSAPGTSGTRSSAGRCAGATSCGCRSCSRSRRSTW